MLFPQDNFPSVARTLLLLRAFRWRRRGSTCRCEWGAGPQGRGPFREAGHGRDTARGTAASHTAWEVHRHRNHLLWKDVPDRGASPVLPSSQELRDGLVLRLTMGAARVASSLHVAVVLSGTSFLLLLVILEAMTRGSPPCLI